jgi:hypothetical protein
MMMMKKKVIYTVTWRQALFSVFHFFFPLARYERNKKMSGTAKAFVSGIVKIKSREKKKSNHNTRKYFF